MQLKCVIIDDEPLARAMLHAILEENCPQVVVVGQGEDVLSGLKVIQQQEPDLVFLDIEMPGYSGFQLLDFFEKPTFQIVFTTAHSEFALRAFQVSAVDYVLKPIQIEAIVHAVDKAMRLVSKPEQNRAALEALRVNLKDNTRASRIALPVAGGLMFVQAEDIVSMEADGAYTKIVLSDGGKLLISKKLKEFEDLLVNNPMFFRTHRSYMINFKFVKQFNRRDGGVIILENDQEVLLTKERKDEFFAQFDALML
jgi:two-component system LytT family response regulator